MVDVEKTCAALERNKIAVLRFKTGAEARDEALRRLPKDAQIALGGSTTTAQIGLQDALRSGGFNLIDAYAPDLAREEAIRRRRQGLLADYFITGTNAITESGELVNMDGLGNRVAAQIFGPRKVFIFASLKKIVPDVHSALHRIRTVAAPMNARRLGLDIPCARGEDCSDCPPARSICNYTVIMHHQSAKDRLLLFLIEEAFGF